jgi:hypothetical protein
LIAFRKLDMRPTVFLPLPAVAEDQTVLTATMTPAPGSLQTGPFTAKGDVGNTATANVIIARS